MEKNYREISLFIFQYFSLFSPFFILSFFFYTSCKYYQFQKISIFRFAYCLARFVSFNFVFTFFIPNKSRMLYGRLQKSYIQKVCFFLISVSCSFMINKLFRRKIFYDLIIISVWLLRQSLYFLYLFAYFLFFFLIKIFNHCFSIWKNPIRLLCNKFEV